jgi:uncharacterized protein (DUF2267 family)
MALMSATGLDVFDKTLQSTNIWLDEISAAIGPDRKLAWKVLSVVLHKLRDRLPLNLSAHLGAELPILVRGIYYDQFEPAKQPVEWDVEAFMHEVSRWLSDARPVAIRSPQHARCSRFCRATFRPARSRKCSTRFPPTFARSGPRPRSTLPEPRNCVGCSGARDEARVSDSRCFAEPKSSAGTTSKAYAFINARQDPSGNDAAATITRDGKSS